MDKGRQDSSDGSKLRHIYERYGLAQAMSYILNTRDTKADHVQCIMRRHDSFARVLLAETGMVSERYEDLSPYRNLNLAKDDLGHVIDADVSDADSLRSSLYPGLISHSFMRVKLFEEGENVCLLTFFSRDSGVFSEEDLHYWIKATEPLGRSLQADFARGTLLPPHSEQVPGHDLISQCAGLTDVLKRMKKAAEADCTVLITGETGTGKNMVARAIHEMSPRRRHFMHVDCGALPEHLVESELFGHERGAFSGAVSQRAGYLENANEGTLFLDEIGELPLAAQTRLLRFLDRHEIVRVGSSHPIPLNVRVIAATNRNLRAMTAEGRFRDDLLYRLRVYSIAIPPLRERREDIMSLAKYFLLRSALHMGIQSVLRPGPQEMDKLYAHAWPGNVRELEHVIVSALVEAREGANMGPLVFELEDAPSQVLKLTGGHAEGGWPSLDDIIDSYVREVISKTKGQIYGKRGAAGILKIHPCTLRNRMEKMGLRAGEPKESSRSPEATPRKGAINARNKS